jgi:hypothetical protein
VKRTLLFALAAVVAAAVALPAAAFAGTLTLHPSGFGPMSYAAWKAQQGLPDSNGVSNQALYFQKMVPTATVAAGVAVIQGLEGQDVSTLTGLQWQHRIDGHCGAGAPRWDLFVRDTAGVRHTVFLGCAAAAHSPGDAPNWIRDSYSASAIQTEVAAQTAPVSGPFTIAGLAIVFDEGTDQGQGFVFLDNIIVNDHCWTSASDNGSNAGTCDPSLTDTFATTGLPDLSLLASNFPDVALTDWTFYPDVLP